MESRSSELKLSQKPVKMVEDEKVFSRISTKEAASMKPGNSFRVYYGGAPAGVPFGWESRPGTPKHKFSDNSIPPLTPPPSYYFNSKSHKSLKKNRNPNVLCALFPKLSTNSKKIYTMSESSFYSVSSSSSPRTSTGPLPTVLTNPESLNSSSCFGVSWDPSCGGRCPMVDVKNALRSVIGHVSAQRTAYNHH